MTLSATNAREETVEVGDARLHLLRGGSGPPLLVLHGIEGPEGWLEVHDRLSRDREVLAPSHPGFGESPRPFWLESITHQAQFYEWFLRAAGIDKVDLVGFGIGGWIAAEMAAMNSDNLSHLVLVDAAGIKPQTGETLDVFIRPWRDVVEACVTDPEGAEEFQRIYNAAPVQAYGGPREAGRSMSMRMCYRPYMYSPALPSLLPGIRTPALIVWGAEDRIIPVECGRQFQTAMPGSKLEVMQGCGHWPHYEKPEELAQIIGRFLRA
jgi:pimeloyl-ACP methyl ester carboxylesterase